MNTQHECMTSHINSRVKVVIVYAAGRNDFDHKGVVSESLCFILSIRFA